MSETNETPAAKPALFPGEKPKRKQRGGVPANSMSLHRLTQWNADSQLMIDLRAAVAEMGPERFAEVYHGTGDKRAAHATAKQGRFPFYVIEAWYAAHKKTDLAERIAKSVQPMGIPANLVRTPEQVQQEWVKKIPALADHLPLTSRLAGQGGKL